MTAAAEWRGLRELRRQLADMRRSVEAQALAEVVEGAAQITADEWKRIVPVGPVRTDSQAHEHYRDTIHVEEEFITPFYCSYLIKSGVTLRPYDVWIEFGTAHNKAYPSCRPAWDATKDSVEAQIREGIMRRIEAAT